MHHSSCFCMCYLNVQHITTIIEENYIIWEHPFFFSFFFFCSMHWATLRSNAQITKYNSFLCLAWIRIWTLKRIYEDGYELWMSGFSHAWLVDQWIVLNNIYRINTFNRGGSLIYYQNSFACILLALNVFKLISY